MSKYRLGEDLDYGTYEITSTACGKTKPLPDQTKRVVTFEGLITDTIHSLAIMTMRRIIFLLNHQGHLRHGLALLRAHTLRSASYNILNSEN